jgi:hypothetical protein
VRRHRPPHHAQPDESDAGFRHCLACFAHGLYYFGPGTSPVVLVRIL